MADHDEELEELSPEIVNSERMRRMKRLMRELYKEEFESKRLRLPPIKGRNILIFFSFVAVVFMATMMLYNFNRLITMEEVVLSTNGHVEDALQRRANLFNNLVNLTLNQAALEQEVFRHVADVRTTLGRPAQPPQDTAAIARQAAAPGSKLSPLASRQTTPQAPRQASPPTSSPEELLNEMPSLARLLAVVERYPEIRSSITYQQLMDKLVEIEDRIAKRRDEYNESVRIFNTRISSFPWYILAKITGFGRYDYFKSEPDEDGTRGFFVPELHDQTFRRLLPVASREQTTAPDVTKPRRAALGKVRERARVNFYNG